jgi:hypothetical protein
MLVGSVLGALIVLLALVIIGQRAIIHSLRKVIAPLAVECNELRKTVAANQAAAGRTFSIGFTDDQIHKLALMINNVRDTQTTTVN